MWRTTFAFQTWHSAIELKRYFLCFIQEFPRIHTLSGVRRSKYNQYDSVIRPIQRWLQQRGVGVEYGVTVTDIEFRDPAARRASALRLTRAGGAKETIELGADDFVFATIGSMTADTTYGDRTTGPELIRDKSETGLGGCGRRWPARPLTSGARRRSAATSTSPSGSRSHSPCTDGRCWTASSSTPATSPARGRS
jgi:myosin-crossreactive antigen